MKLGDRVLVQNALMKVPQPATVLVVLGDLVWVAIDNEPGMVPFTKEEVRSAQDDRVDTR